MYRVRHSISAKDTNVINNNAEIKMQHADNVLNPSLK